VFDLWPNILRIDTLRSSHYEFGHEKVQVKTMRFRCVFLVALVLSGCAGFDDHYYYHDGWVMEGYPSAPSSCGCPTTPYMGSHAGPHTPPPPFSGGPTITPVSGSASPQTREPELLR